MCHQTKADELAALELMCLDGALYTWTIVGLETFLLTEELHAHRTVGNLARGDGPPRAHLLIGVPGTQMGEQVVLLVKIQGADKALELGPKTEVTL